MKVTINEMENATVIKLEGELKLGSEATDFQEGIYNSIDKNKKNVIVDLSALKFISSWGIGMLIHGYTTAQNRDVSFKLVSVPEAINETFRKIKIENIFQQFDTVDDALKS